MVLSIRTTEEKRQKIYCITLGALLSYLPITNFVNNVFNIVIRFNTTIDTLICYLCLLALMLRSITLIYKKMKKDIMIFLSCFLLVWLISYGFLGGKTEPQLFFTTWGDVVGNPFYILFVYSFFGYVLTRYITDYDLFCRVLAGFSLAVVMCSTLSFFMTLNGGNQAQYMVFSYNMTMHSVFAFLYYFEKRNPLYLFVGVLGFVMILMAGCRGAIVCIAVSMVLYALFSKMKPFRKMVLIGALLIAVIVVVMNFDGILNYLIDVAEKLDIDSRTLNKISEGDFFVSVGRNKIRAEVINSFDIYGHGLYGDRTLTKQNTYAHNLMLEMLSHHGYILGSILMAVIVIMILRGISSQNRRISFLVIVMMSTGFCKLFFSGSYLHQEPAFYVLLGLCMNSIKERRRWG